MIELLLKLEMSLWINETRNNVAYLDEVLHTDFKEFGMSGKAYNKRDIIEDTELDIHAVFPFKELAIKQLDDHTFLLTYQSETLENGESIKSNRSSIWVGAESFQLIFHQGTPVQKMV